MKIAIASDHGGFDLKETLKLHLSDRNIDFEDLGTRSSMVTVDAQDYARKVVHAVLMGEVDSGILICKTGISMSIAANRNKDIRAAVTNDVFSAKESKEHNNANIICLGQCVIGDGLAKIIVDAWIEAMFQGNCYQKTNEYY